MFPTEISPLIPALQSDWLHIHVTTAAAGQAILAISFVAAIIYLVKCRGSVTIKQKNILA